MDHKRNSLVSSSLSIVALVLLFSAIFFTLSSTVQKNDVRSRASSNFTPTSGRPFADNSPFNDPIGTNVQLDPNSAAMVSKAAASPAIADFIEFGTPIFFADASTPKYNIKCSAGYGDCFLEHQPVPIPDGAKSAPGSDGQMVVVDLSTNKTYDFWIYQNDHANTAWGDVIDITGPGYDSPENSALGAGTSRLAGIVRTYEMTSSIEHALVFSTESCDKQMRVPATKSDGQSGGIPEGARFQLDPSINVDTLSGITPGEKVVAKAMQKYGAYAIDCGGASMAMQFENPIGKTDPYAGVGFSNDYFAMSHIPWDKMRVLKAWNSYTPVAGGTNPSTAPQPTNITPTLYCLGGVPCDGPSPSNANPSSNPSSGASQTPGGGSTNPSTNPSPSVSPCQTSNTSAFTNNGRGRKHHHHRGGFLSRFLKFLFQFLEALFKLLGISIPGFPGGGGTPCPTPSATPSTTPSTAPSTIPSPSTGVSVAPSVAPSVQPSSVPSIVSNSPIWSGYALRTPIQTNSTITANWQVTLVDCAAGDGWFSPWVGQGGFDGDGKIAQLGSTSTCWKTVPEYSSWTERYPDPVISITNPTALGDQMTATVTYTGSGAFTTTISNITKGWKVDKPMAFESTYIPPGAEIITESYTNTTTYPVIPKFADVIYTNSTYSPDGQQKLSLEKTSQLLRKELVVNGISSITTSPITAGSFKTIWVHN
jgi:hypothetical protein